MSYGDLTEAEQAHYDEYATLRGITDWPGFDAKQEARKRAAREWIKAARGRVEDAAEKDGWSASRKGRYETLAPDVLNTATAKHEVRLPAPAALTPTERVYVEEREGYLALKSATKEQASRKVANSRWLIDRRQKLFRLIRDEPNSKLKKERQQRYDALAIATQFGPAYRAWKESHNKYGQPVTEEDNTRAEIVAWCRRYLGVHENPSGSNRGAPQPNAWEVRVYGGTGVPWCACFAVCSAWDAGIKGQGTASVALNVSLARKGQGIYRGYTTDPTRVRAGDHAIIGSTTSHTGVVVGPTAWDTIEGNTSPGAEGSQFNGGCVARRNRPGQIVGWALIRE